MQAASRPVETHARPSHRELDEARLQMLRVRFRLFCLIVGAIVILLTLLSASVAWTSPAVNPSRAQRISLLANLLVGVLVAIMPQLRAQRFADLALPSMIRRTNVVVVMAVFSQFTGAVLLAAWLTQILARFEIDMQVGPLIPLVALTALVHVSASLVVPWTLAESARPALILLASLAAIELISGDPPHAKLIGLAAIASAVLPGLVISWLRYAGLRATLEMSILSGRYREMQRELAYARRVHERLFPLPISVGPLHMSFSYEPMRQIGGDYLDAHVTPSGALSLVLIDVTGHGIAAALAVNRLHGEIKRVFAQEREAPPQRVIDNLNQYVLLTLSNERVFATALALRAEPASGRVEVCNAGHPPALIRRRDGRVEQLDSTAPLLGVMGPPAFTADTQQALLEPGEVLLAYTDGALECRNAGGAQLGIEGLADALRSAKGESLERILERLGDAVQRFRAGSPEDDTLLVAIRRETHPAATAMPRV